MTPTTTDILDTPECIQWCRDIWDRGHCETTAGVFADWLADQGAVVEEEAIRWMLAKRKKPSRHGWWHLLADEHSGHHIPKPLACNALISCSYDRMGMHWAYYCDLMARWREMIPDERAAAWAWNPRGSESPHHIHGE